ncbi:hypothetical protein R2R70_22105, partial [Cobetia sp. SIMBA_158]|uniref:hypothetical protein n=1 Tax=Cobetia sp. SIMBA_158 TaxID=3081617 RepID=UPI0039808910
VLTDAYETVFTLFNKLINPNKPLHNISHLQLCQSKTHNFVVIRHTKAISDEAKAVVIKACTPYKYSVIWQSESDVIDHTNIT